MPYTIRKRSCKQASGKRGTYVLSYTDNKGKQHSNCHTSRKKAKGQIAAIEAEGVQNESLLKKLIVNIIEEMALNNHKTKENTVKIRLSELRKIIRKIINEGGNVDVKVIEPSFEPTAEFNACENDDLEESLDEEFTMPKATFSAPDPAKLFNPPEPKSACQMGEEQQIEEQEVDEGEFTYAIAKAAKKGKKQVDIGGEKFPVKMSKEKAAKIVGKQKQ